MRSQKTFCSQDRLSLGFLPFHVVPYKGATRRVTEQLEYLVRGPKKFVLCEEIGGMM